MTVDSFAQQGPHVEHQFKQLRLDDEQELEEGEIRDEESRRLGVPKREDEPVGRFEDEETLEEGQIRSTASQIDLDDEISFKPSADCRRSGSGLSVGQPSACLAETTLILDASEQATASARSISLQPFSGADSCSHSSCSSHNDLSSQASGAGYETPPRLVHGGKENAVEIYYTSPTRLDQGSECAAEHKSAPAAKDESPACAREALFHVGDARLELLQSEIESLQAKYNSSLQSIANLKGVLSEYESAMSSMITDSQAMRSEQSLLLAASQREKEQLQSELAVLATSQLEMKQRYDDMKIISDGFRKNEEMLQRNIDGLSANLVASERRYEGLKVHAEEKLEAANQEISRVRAAFEKEISAYKIKLAKTELAVSSLQATIDQKTTENRELMNICDELIQKMDAPVSQ